MTERLIDGGDVDMNALSESLRKMADAIDNDMLAIHNIHSGVDIFKLEPSKSRLEISYSANKEAIELLDLVDYTVE